MIYSMTGFATTTRETPLGLFSLELRSVNNRFLDIQFRMPDDFRKLEPAMRECLTSQLSRGKVECRLSYASPVNMDDGQQLDQVLLEKLLQLDQTIRTRHPAAQPLSVAEILNWPGMMGNDLASDEALSQTCLEQLQSTLDELKSSRTREGQKLQTLLLERTQQMRQLMQDAAPRIPALLAAFEEKLRTRIEEALGALEEDRIRQEITLFAGKIDVDEELSRLHTHLDEVDRILKKGGVVGKRLDFMMQELNREANTLGSKSVDLEISRISMELKVLIEQMREQVQNIE